MRETNSSVPTAGWRVLRSMGIPFFAMIAAAFMGCRSPNHRSEPILVKQIPMPPWLMKLDAPTILPVPT